MNKPKLEEVLALIRVEEKLWLFLLVVNKYIICIIKDFPML